MLYEALKNATGSLGEASLPPGFTDRDGVNPTWALQLYP